MSRSIFLGAAALATAVALPTLPAQAQGEARTEAAITILAPRVAEEHEPGSLRTQRTLTASSLVYYDDLALDTEAGREELKLRVKTAAKETCDWLDDIYPLDGAFSDNRDCMIKATKAATAQVEAAIGNYDA